MLFIFINIQMRKVGGTDAALWLMVGMMGFLMFRRTAAQTQNAVNANTGLFTYRQVKPIDTVLVRGVLEGFLVLVITMILFGGAALFGLSVLPADPLSMLEAGFGLWLLGIGFGLIASVATELIPELGKLIDYVMVPMNFISGAVFPIGNLPEPYRGWLFLNPVAQGMEAARQGFATYYHAAPELSIAYLYESALVLVFLGLVLHVRFATRLIAQ